MKPPRLTTFRSALVILSSLCLSNYSRAQTQVTVSPGGLLGRRRALHQNRYPARS